MQIAITGGCGRIGKAVVSLALAQGHSVVNLDQVPLGERPAETGSRQLQIDLTDYDAFAQAIQGCEALIHLAAIPAPFHQPDHIVHNSNVVMSYNALHAAASQGIHRVCLASSINATGAFFSRQPRYDYLPLDEQHPTYNEDPYSLSKWLAEEQADSLARRYEAMTIASLRLHGTRPDRPPSPAPDDPKVALAAKQLWGYTRLDAAARACLLALTASFTGHERFYIVAPETMMTVPSLELWARFYPDVPLRKELRGREGFYDCSKAEQLLDWRHEE